MHGSGRPTFARIIVVVSTSIPLAVLCLQSLSLRWYADDFLYAASARVHGFAGAQVWWYTQWSGRFVYTFVATTLLALGPGFASVIAILTIVSLLWILARSVGLPLALAAAYVLLLGSPDFLQTAFWFTGMLTYVTPLLGLAWWTFARLPDENARPVDFALPFLLSGFSEAGALCNIVYFAITAVAWRRRSSIVACLASMVTFVLIAVAPGNVVRLAAHHQEVSLPLAFKALRAVGTHFTGVATSLGFAMVVVFATAALFAPRSSTRACVVAVICAFASALTVYGVVFAATGQMPPGRVVVIPHAFLIAAAGVTGARMPLLPQWRLALTIAAVVASLSAPLFHSWETAVALPDLRRQAKAWDALHTELSRVPGRDVIVAHAPAMIGTQKFITHSREDVMNAAVAGYYGLRSIATAPPDASSRIVDPDNVVRLRWTGPPG